MKFYLKKKRRGVNIAGHMRSLRGLRRLLLKAKLVSFLPLLKFSLTLICFYFLMPIHETPAFGTVGLNIELEVLSVVI